MKYDYIKIYCYKNVYNCTIKQLKVNYDKKTFEIGSFTQTADKLTRKAFYNLIDELKAYNFKEVK